MINKFYKLFPFHGLRGKNTRDSIVCVGDLFWLQEKHVILNHHTDLMHLPCDDQTPEKTSRTSIFQEINNKIFYKLNGWVLTICYVGAGWVVIQMFDPNLLPFCFPRRHFKMQISFIAKA